MDIQIIFDKQNPYLKRREVKFSIISEKSTPSRAEVLKEICSRLNVNPEYSIIASIMQDFGIGKSTAVLHVYNSKEELQKHEPKYLLERIQKKSAAKSVENNKAK
ncbi:MAG: 30S ribosomal protein S24e [Candidatus Micrarchaeia archaeon]